jgi:UDP-N-acetyl-D-galactosamine dehydrogenase
LSEWDAIKNVDGLVLAVSHRAYLDMGIPKLLKLLRNAQEGVVVDVKSMFDEEDFPKSLKYWRL